MKQILLFILLALPLSIISAQTITTNTPNLTVNGSKDDIEWVGHGMVTNQGNAANFTWTIFTDVAPNGWTVNLCDKNQCYIEGVATCPASKPVVLASSATSIMDLHIHANGIDGCGTYRVVVSEIANPSNSVTITYNACTTTGTHDLVASDINVYPNPTSQYFTIDNGDGLGKIQVYNMVGKQVRSFTYSNGGKYNVDSLTPGLYLVQMNNLEGKIIKTIRLNVR